MKLKNHGRFRPSCVAPSAEMNSRTRLRDPLIRSRNFCATQLRPRLASLGYPPSRKFTALVYLRINKYNGAFRDFLLVTSPVCDTFLPLYQPDSRVPQEQFSSKFPSKFRNPALPPSLSFSLVCPIRVTGRGGSTANRILAISSPLAIIILVHGKLSGCTFVSTPWRLATLGNTWLQTIMYEKERKLFRINLVQILKYVKHSENKRNAFLSYIFERIV